MSRRLSDLMLEYKRSIVVATLRRNDGNQSATARILGISKRQIERLVVEYKISRRRYARKLPFPPNTVSKVKKS
jgi:DNA-binding NtrC family response regulator